MIEINLCDNLVEKISGEWSFLVIHGVQTPYDQFQKNVARQQIHPDERKTFLKTFSREAIKSAYSQDHREITLQYRRLSEKRQMVWVETTAHIIQDPATAHLKVLFFIRNIDKEKRHELILQYQSQRDSLSGLLNKGSTEAQIQSVLESHPQALHALLILDIDEFKQINDTFGHLDGDQVLARIARQIREVFRADDVLGRIGGDEFLIFMEYKDHLEQMIERIFRSLNGSYQGYDITLSMGIACFPKDGSDYLTLFHHADQALYAAKRRGRRQYCLYDDSMQDLLTGVSTK